VPGQLHCSLHVDARRGERGVGLMGRRVLLTGIPALGQPPDLEGERHQASGSETFPFPPNWQQNPTLEAAGKTYYEHRAALMTANDEGLTTTYNRFHDPDETAPAILRLRELHAAMDRAVLDAYGWGDLAPTCAFLLDYEEEEDDDGAARASKKRKPRTR
jgi:hypothetical protein